MRNGKMKFGQSGMSLVGLILVLAMLAMVVLLAAKIVPTTIEYIGVKIIIEKTDSGFEVSFSYTKKIALVGPASLLLEYQGSTAKGPVKPKAQE